MEEIQNVQVELDQLQKQRETLRRDWNEIYHLLWRSGNVRNFESKLKYHTESMEGLLNTQK